MAFQNSADLHPAGESTSARDAIPKADSKKLLEMIRGGEICPEFFSRYSISSEDALALRRRYAEVLTSGPQMAHLPRNWAFHKIIEQATEGRFRWSINDQLCKKPRPSIRRNELGRVIRFSNADAHRGPLPTLASMLLGRVKQEHPFQRRFPQVAELPSAVTDRLSELFNELRLVAPSPAVMTQVVLCIQRGLAGEVVDVVSPSCPDYSYEVTGDPHAPYRYTFNSVGDGVGVVAAHGLRVQEAFHRFFSELGVATRFHLVSGDFEGLSQANLKQLGITEETFLRQVASSVRALAAAAPYPVESLAFGDLIDLRPGWLDLCRSQEQALRLTLQDKGWSADLTDKFKAREPLYRSWMPGGSIRPVKAS